MSAPKKKMGRPLAGDRDAILDDYRDGLYLRVIAERHNVSQATVQKYARDAELTGRVSNGCKCKSWRVCNNCTAEIPLTEGRWVLDPVRRIQVWEPDDVA